MAGTPLTGRLDADFGPFLAAVDAAETSLRSFESGSAKVQSQLDRMVDSFSGRKIITDATLMSEAVERVGGVSTLTAGELQRVGTVAQEAVDKFRALGQDVPPGIQNIADRARGAAEETARMGESAKTTGDTFKEWAGKFDLKTALSDPLGTAKSGVLAFAETLGPTGVALAAVGTAAVGTGVALWELASNAAAAGAAFDDMADKTGMSVPALSQLSNAANVIGADMGQLTDVVFKLQTGLASNTEEFQAGLAKMGLSTAELKAAGPDAYLELVSAGLSGITDTSARAAAGTAVLGRGYRDVAASLNDLQAGFAATADLSPWTAEQAAAAEAFEQKVASLKTHVSAAALALGNELIPAATLAVDALVSFGKAAYDTSGLKLVVDGYKLLKGALGETALAAETAGAVHDTTTRLFAAQGATAESVATQMLTLGYSQQTVARETGLAADEVRRLSAGLKTTQTDAENYAAAWDRINKLYDQGIPSIAGVSASTRGLVADMQAMKAKVEDITAVTGMSAAQQELLTKARADDAAARKKELADEEEAVKRWAKSNEDANKAAMKHSQDLRAEENQRGVELLKTNEDGYKAVAALREKYRDETMKDSMDLATYQITKIWEKAQAEVDAFKGTDAQAAEHTDLVFTLAEREARAITDVMEGAVVTTGAALDQMFGKATFVLAETEAKADAAVAKAQQYSMVGGQQMSAHDWDEYYKTPQGIQDIIRNSGKRYYATDHGPELRATGGPVAAGSPYVVGERGPELFVPSGSGAILPSGGGAVANVVIYVNGTAEDVARQVAAEIMRTIKAGQQLGAAGT